MYSKADAALWNGRIDDNDNRAHFRNFQVAQVVDAEGELTERFDVGILG